MESSDTLSLVLRYGLIVVFLAYYVIGWILSARLVPSAVRRLILRWAWVPLLIVGAICISCLCFKCAEGRMVLRAFLATVGLSMLGAIAFSVWLQRSGGKELLYVPIAFAKFGSDSLDRVTYAVAELSSGKPDIRRDFILSLLPALFAIVIVILLIWETSRPLGS